MVLAREQGTHLMLVAALGGVVVGTGTLARNAHRLRAHRGEVGGPVVHPDHQRKGIARRIVDEIRQQAIAMGLEILEVSCRGGTPPESVYRRLGFVECGRLPRGLIELGIEPRVFDEVSFFMPLDRPR